MQDITNNQVYTSPKRLSKLLHTNFILKKKNTAKFFFGCFQICHWKDFIFHSSFQGAVASPLKNLFRCSEKFWKVCDTGLQGDILTPPKLALNLIEKDSGTPEQEEAFRGKKAVLALAHQPPCHGPHRAVLEEKLNINLKWSTMTNVPDEGRITNII